MGSLTRRPLLTVSVTAVTCAALMTGRGAALAGGSPAGAPGAAPGVAFSGGIWRNAEQVPGTASLNAGGEAAIFSVSCASAGNCGGGGVYKDASLRRHAFVVSQRNGKWGKAVEVKSTNLNASSFSEIFSVSCPAAGNCSAGGRYEAGSSGRYQAFVVSQRNGTWGTAIEVPGTATLNAGANATVSSLSCSSAGNCAAGGQYMGKSGRFQPFVVSQRDGKWGKALRVPGTSVLNAGGNASVSAMSCPSAAYCAAAGYYKDSARHYQAFVVSQRNGKWSKALKVPGTAGLNVGGNAGINSVSCPSAGNCAGAGTYEDAGRLSQAFVVSERSGKWGKAIEVAGTARLNAGGDAAASSVSCSSVGNCAAAGLYKGAAGHFQAFVVNQRSGKWSKAIEVPGLGALNAGGHAGAQSVSCSSAGNCGAGGSYEDGSYHSQAFVVSQRNGTWGKAIEVPATAGLNVDGSATTSSVSCAAAGRCSAGGSYEDASAHYQAFVVSQS